MSAPAPPQQQGQRPRSADPQPLVWGDRLTKAYPLRRGILSRAELVRAVDSVSLYVRHAEIVGLVGESGSGKTTVGKMLLRLVDPTIGRVHFDGQDITRIRPGALRALRSRMQMVFQDPATSLDPAMSIRDVVAEGVAAHREPPQRSARDEAVVAALRRVGLGPELLRRKPGELSGGQRQRVAIARAMAVEPELLVCDEPVSALDLSVQSQLLNLLAELRETTKLSVLFVSHDLRAVVWLSDRVMVLYRGRIVEEGPTASVVERLYHPYTRALFQAIPTGARRLLSVVPTEGAAPEKGCGYVHRCPRAEFGRCEKSVPPLAELTPKSRHRVACFHPVRDP